MRFLCWLTLAVASLASAYPASAQQPARVGLFIGNANYPDAPTPLGTAIKDARALAAEFRRLAFETEVKENVGKEEMQRAIDAFLSKLTKDTVAVLYFGGYGLQVARQNYLVPVNAQIWNEGDAKRDGFSIESIVTEMNRKGVAVKIIIVDAAYRNPFERRFRDVPAGLAALDSPPGTLVIYSAALGRVMNGASGENSLLASELIKELRAPGRSVELIFNDTRRGVSRASNNEQIPWVASSLVEDFSFTRTRTAAPSPSPAPTPVPAPSTPAPPAPTPTPPAPLPPVPQLGPAPTATIKAIFEKFNLIGTFAYDCSRPASPNNNWYFVNRLLPDNRVQRDFMTTPGKQDVIVFLDRAEELSATEIRVSGTRDGQPVEGVWIVEKNRMIQWQASRSGRKEIVDGRYTSSGVKLMWLNRCGR